MPLPTIPASPSICILFITRGIVMELPFPKYLFDVVYVRFVLYLCVDWFCRFGLRKDLHEKSFEIHLLQTEFDRTVTEETTELGDRSQTANY